MSVARKVQMRNLYNKVLVDESD